MRAPSLLVLLAAACGAPPTLTRVESEVFTKSCLFQGCHVGSAAAEGLNLEAPTHAKLVGVKAKAVGATDRTLVVPGDPDASYLYQKLVQSMPLVGAQMPNTGDPLEADRLALVRDWISAGAQND